jgi:methenyltetrahydrofolate cyclohydrolase
VTSIPQAGHHGGSDGPRDSSGPPQAQPGEQPRYLSLPLREFLGELAAPGPAPAAGSAAALAVALAASLCEKAAALSARQLGDETAAGLALVAHRAGARSMELVDADAAAYVAVIRAKRAARAAGGQPADMVADALTGAAEVPLQVMETAAQIAPIAVRLAGGGNPNLRGDAITAGLLVHAAARAAAVLMDINQTDPASGGSEGPAATRTARARALLSGISAGTAGLDSATGPGQCGR